MSRHNVHIFCGTGIGKTAAALGKGVREACDGKNVFLIQFLKGKQTDTEREYYDRMEPEIKMFRFEKFPGDFCSLEDWQKEEEIRNMKNGLNFARKVIVTNECEVLILDEILGLLDQGIITKEELLVLIDSVGEEMTLYLTGTSRCEELWPYVDEVTEMTTVYRRTQAE